MLLLVTYVPSLMPDGTSTYIQRSCVPALLRLALGICTLPSGAVPVAESSVALMLKFPGPMVSPLPLSHKSYPVTLTLLKSPLPVLFMTCGPLLALTSLVPGPELLKVIVGTVRLNA